VHAAKFDWGLRQPMVDVGVFGEISNRLDGHSRAPKERKRRRRELFPLSMACAHCGGAYNGGRLSAAQGQPRVYAHSKPKERMHPEQYSRTIDAGCKVWTLDAEEIESGVKNLIVKQRSSDEFKADVKALILERDNFRENAREAVALAKRDVEQREVALRRLARMAAAAADGIEDDANDDALVEQLKIGQGLCEGREVGGCRSRGLRAVSRERVGAAVGHHPRDPQHRSGM
jgi:hypothetical protein